MNTRLRKLIARLVIVSLIASIIVVPSLWLREAHADNTVYYAIKASTNKFLTIGTNNEISATMTSVSTAAEQFELIKNDDHTYSLKAKSNNKYVTASGTAILTASSATMGATEKFTRENDSDPYLKASNNKYVKVNNDSAAALSASATSKGEATSFQFAKDVTKLLEITDSGISDLQAVLGPLPNMSIETVSMKRFVALRGELDGKYDAIYIGKGNYNPEQVALTTDGNRASKHDTKGLENDITMLKANEIVDKFIRKDQLILIYSDPSQKSGLIYQGYYDNNKFVSSTGNLYNTFAPYATTKRDNVVFLDSTALANLSSTFSNYNEHLNQRPNLVLSSYPISYLVDSTKLYRAGDTLTFAINIPNKNSLSNRTLTANLYMGLDQAVTFGNDQIVASTNVSGSNGEISYVLPKGFSGLYYWKIELIDTGTQLKSYETGIIRYRDQQTVVRVLQVMPNNSDTSSLKKQNNLKQEYLTSTDEYRIDITTTTFDNFNNSDKTGLNGSYDMLIFGLADSYNENAGITAATAEAVNKFIQTGQSVMFTHDTVYSNNGSRNTWINSFQTTTGQIDPWTNLGLYAPNQSTSVTKVNDGLLNQFPFNLNASTPQVANTHNQYFTLNLEDETVVPWYNITGSNRDENDSWNHYYTYSKGNVTYSGTGHTNSNFPDWEQRLFVNTMFRAFMGSNHAPMLTVYNPLDYSSARDNFVPNYYENINLSFMPEDYDFKDRNLNVSISYSYNDGTGMQKVELTPFDAISGSTVNRAIPNPFTDNGGDLTIQITVTDKAGAKVTKDIPVKVKKISSNLSVSRTLEGLAPGAGSELVMNRNTTAAMTYTVTPAAITKSDAEDTASIIVQDITFNETLPAGLEIAGELPSNLTKNGDSTTGYSIHGTLNNITYTLASDGKSYTASPIIFSINLKPIVKGVLPLNNASLTFRDIGQSAVISLPFEPYTINSIVRIDNLSISNILLVNRKDSKGNLEKEDTATIIPNYSPSDATTNFIWEISSSSIPNSPSDVASIDTLNNGNGYITAHKKGTATVTVTDSITRISATATVEVTEPGLNITGPEIVGAGSAIDLNYNFPDKPDREKIKDISWSVFNPENGSQGKAILSSNNGEQTKLTGIRAGTVKVILNVTTTSSVNGSTITYENEKVITIVNPVLNSRHNGTIGVGDRSTIHVSLSSALDNKPLTDISIIQKVTWSLKETDTESLADLAADTETNLKNELSALAPGRVTVIVSVQLEGGTILTKELPFTILNREIVINGNSTVRAGDTLDLQLDWLGPVGVPVLDKQPTWELKNNDSAFIRVNSLPTNPNLAKLTTSSSEDGRTVTVLVSIETPAGIRLTAEKTIDVVRLSLPDMIEINQGNSSDLTDVNILKITPDHLRSPIVSTLRWETENSSIVDVTPSGIITGKGQGTTTITAIYPELNIRLSTTVTVKINTDKY